eukprot:jgi/Botrbrau1/23669/Bobra.55_2s0050.1
MVRIDGWQVNQQQTTDDHIPNFARKRDLVERYSFGAVLGQGAYGVVREVMERATGLRYACKAISKVLPKEEAVLLQTRQAEHTAAIRREIAVLTTLQFTKWSCVSVVRLKEVLEDDDNVYIIQELCEGGELCHSIGKVAYSERRAAGYMRAILRVIEQCHDNKIMHRDVKPGNFMLLNHLSSSPLKAIDFGLAVFYDPQQLPRTDLGLDGTPWFMAPETLSCRWEPASDIWAAGVTAYQLLCGHLPFDDRSNPNQPALTKVWRAILTEEPNFKSPVWSTISPRARDFVTWLLNKEADKRPTAREALEHAWLKGASILAMGREEELPLDPSVVHQLNARHRRHQLKRLAAEWNLVRTKSVPIKTLPRRLGSLDLVESSSPHARHWNIHAHGSASFKWGHVPRDSTPLTVDPER